MAQLTLLDLSHNKLKVLLNDAFNGLNELEALYIHTNQIRYIEGNTFGSMRNLKTISIRKNSGHCDCSWIHLMSRLEFYDIVVIDRDYFSECGSLPFQCNTQSYTSPNFSLTATSASLTNLGGIMTEITPTSEDVSRSNGRQLSRLASSELVHLEVRDGILFHNGSSTSLNISTKAAQGFVLRYDHVIRNRIYQIEDEKVRDIMSRVFHRQMSSFIKKYFELEPSSPTRSEAQNYTDGNVTNISRHLVAEETSMIAVAACIPIISFLVIYFTLQYVYEARKDKGFVEISADKNSNQNRSTSDNRESATMSCCCARCLNAITTKLAVRKKYVDQSEQPSSSRFRKIHEDAKMAIDKNKQETKPSRKLSMVSSLKKITSTLSQKRKEKQKSGETSYSLEGNHLEPEYCQSKPRSGTVLYSSDDASNSERSWDESVMLNTNANHSACSDPNDTYFEEIELP